LRPEEKSNAHFVLLNISEKIKRAFATRFPHRFPSVTKSCTSNRHLTQFRYASVI
jgi:hypothetical protein